MKYIFAAVAAVLLSAQIVVAQYDAKPPPVDRVCQRSCFGYPPKCGEGLEAVKLGDCWTCCTVPKPQPYGYDGDYKEAYDN